MNRTGVALFAALLVASAVVAAVVVHARTPDLELQVTRLTSDICPQLPVKECRRDAKQLHPNRSAGRRAHISFFVRESDPHATVEIVGRDLSHVKTFYTGPLVGGRQVSYVWNGRDAAGKLVDPRQRYRLRVILPSRGRDMVYPLRIRVLEPRRS